MTPDPLVSPRKIESIRKYAKAIFDPIKRGESVTCVWVPMAGRRIITRYIINNPSLFTDVIGDPTCCLLVYLEPMQLTEESLVGYLRLMGRSLLEACRTSKYVSKTQALATSRRLDYFSDESATATHLLDELRSLIEEIIDLDTEVVFFLGKFDELAFTDTLFYNNLRSLWGSFQPRLHYVFLTRSDITRFETARQYAGLVSVIMQNIVYVPLLSEEDVEYLLKNEEERAKTRFTSPEREVLQKVCGSHPYLLIIGCRTLANREDRKKLNKGELAEVLLAHHQLDSPAREIFALRNVEERGLLKKIVDGGVKDLPEVGKVLERLGLIKKDKDSGEYTLFCQLFAKAVLGAKKSKPGFAGVPETLTWDPETGAILLGERTIEEELTRQEYDVLAFLLKEVNKLKKRDEIADIIWGEESYDKYSDWSIDQLMSKLRKKLEKLGVGRKSLVTIRGRGYKFVRAGQV